MIEFFVWSLEPWKSLTTSAAIVGLSQSVCLL